MFQFDSFTDRQPFGAVRNATTIHFTAKADGAVTQASLIIMPDGRGDQTETLPMTKKPEWLYGEFCPTDGWFMVLPF